MDVAKVDFSRVLHEPGIGDLNRLPFHAEKSKNWISQRGGATSATNGNEISPGCKEALEMLKNAGTDIVKQNEAFLEIQKKCSENDLKLAQKAGFKQRTANSQITTQSTQPQSDVNVGTVLLVLGALVVYSLTLGGVQLQAP